MIGFEDWVPVSSSVWPLSVFSFRTLFPFLTVELLTTLPFSSCQLISVHVSIPKSEQILLSMLTMVFFG